ncbi:MAG TPA: DNA primase [Nitrospirota bacterium]|nr:DNA primase [Nitrospirota bacterium]
MRKLDGGLIPDEIVDRVRSVTDIVELVSEYVALKRSGANYMGLCPFHPEKTPSFTVSPSKQIFHCFGCGAGGDAFSFLMRHGNFTYPEAIRRLADRAGIPIPEAQARGGRPKEEYDALYAANAEALAFFVERLASKEGARAREYLAKRGMSEAAAGFSIGYSPAGWDGLIKRLEKKGFNPDAAVKAGLAVKRSEGEGCYDRFRDRLMFPIKDVRGRVIGFGGRTMGEDTPKYLNSPETPVFRKGDTLYGIDIASDHIRKKDYAVVCEGYFDAIACQTAGVTNAVATLGTALTPAHLRLIGRYSKNVLVVFDSDAAGIKAAERSLDVFLGTSMTAKVALLPPGDDPDSLVRREGRAGLSERLKGSEKLLDFVIRREAMAATDIDAKVKAVAKLTAVLARIDNGVERGYYAKKAAIELGVDEQAVREELGKKLGRTPSFTGPRIKPAASMNKIEEGLLSVMLSDPELAVKARGELSTDDFAEPALRRLAEKVFALAAKDGEVKLPKLLDALADEDERRLALSLSVRELPDDAGGFTEGAVKRLVEGRRTRRGAELMALIRQAEEKKDHELLNKLQKEFIEWQKRIS